MVSGIYSIKNKINNKRYIGQSKNIERRKETHFHKLETNTHINTHLQNAYNLYGSSNFEFKIIKICKTDELDYFEDYYINKYNSLENGYNLCEGGLNNCPDNTNENHGMWRNDIHNGLIKQMYLAGKQSTEICKIFNCSRRTIDRRLHKIFDDEFLKETHKQRQSKALTGRKNPRGELNPNYDKSVPNGKQLYAERLHGITQVELAKKYNTTQATISERICSYTNTLSPSIIKRNHAKDKLWDNFVVGYRKGDMCRRNRTPNPCSCFYLKINGVQYYDISSMEWLSFELIADLIEEYCKE